MIGFLPAEKSPTVSRLADAAWVAVEVILEEKQERELIPALKRAGATGIITYPAEQGHPVKVYAVRDPVRDRRRDQRAATMLRLFCRPSFDLEFLGRLSSCVKAWCVGRPIKRRRGRVVDLKLVARYKMAGTAARHRQAVVAKWFSQTPG